MTTLSFPSYQMAEFRVVPDDPELPAVALPAEAMYEALLEEQASVPYESRNAPSARAGDGANGAAPAPMVAVPPNAVLLKGPALKLAQNMDASLAIPVATTFRDIPVRALEAHRAELNTQLKSVGRSEKLSLDRKSVV